MNWCLSGVLHTNLHQKYTKKARHQNLRLRNITVVSNENKRSFDELCIEIIANVQN